MQDSERDTDVYNGLLDSEGGRGWDDLGEKKKKKKRKKIKHIFEKC